MTVAELKEKIANGDDFLLLDIREKDEVVENGAIDGSQNMPMGAVFVEASRGNLPKDKKIVTVCKSGGRCQIVQKELVPKGFDIDYLEGGMDEWNKVT